MNRFELINMVKNNTSDPVAADRLMVHIDTYVHEKRVEALDRAFHAVAILPYEGWFCRKKVTLRAALVAVNDLYLDWLGVESGH